MYDTLMWRVGKLEHQLTRLESRLTELEHQLTERMEELESRLAELDDRLSGCVADLKVENTNLKYHLSAMQDDHSRLQDNSADLLYRIDCLEDTASDNLTSSLYQLIQDPCEKWRDVLATAVARGIEDAIDRNELKMVAEFQDGERVVKVVWHG